MKAMNDGTPLFVLKGTTDAAGMLADLIELYHALDLYLMTSREEGGPMALMESMASGVPVVATSVGMAPDLIVDGVTGGLAASEDVEGLVDRARSILALDDSERALLVAKARAAPARTNDELYADLKAAGIFTTRSELCWTPDPLW